MDTSSALELSFSIGQTLLENGAEISRVQETMERVAAAYQTEEFNVYVLTNAIFANGIEQGVTHHTKIKFVPAVTVHTGRISALNQLSREITCQTLTVPQAFTRLQEIRSIPFIKPPLSLFACGLGSACCALMFGGSVLDFCAAFLCGFLLEGYLFLLGKAKVPVSKFISNLTAGALMALLACLFFLLGLGTQLDKIVSGSIIRLVPGLALTTSIRDFFNGDYLSGTIRMFDTALIGVCIGIGVGVVIRLMSLLTGGVLL